MCRIAIFFSVRFVLSTDNSDFYIGNNVYQFLEELLFLVRWKIGIGFVLFIYWVCWIFTVGFGLRFTAEFAVGIEVLCFFDALDVKIVDCFHFVNFDVFECQFMNFIL
jgi:hypothetical protein